MINLINLGKRNEKKIGIAIIIIIILLLGKIEIEDNLKMYSVYYIKNMEHKGGFEPELMLLIDNLDMTDQREVKGMKYRVHGTHSIQNNRVQKVKTHPQFRSGSHDGKREYSYEDTNERLYTFDSHFKMIEVTDFNNGIQDLDISKFDEQAIKQELYELMKPVLEVHEKAPDINLQWLFNLLNYEKFN